MRPRLLIRALVPGFAILALVGLAGCDIAPKSAGGTPTGTTSWLAFPPVSMGIHPLTRIVRDTETGHSRIEAHIELIDAYDHFVKGLGSFLFESASLEGEPLEHPDGSAIHWQIDARTPSAASEPFDPLTRTYRFVLTGVPESATRADALLLRVTFVPTAGERLRAERPIRLDRPLP